MECTNSQLVKRTSYSKYYSAPREYPITRITPHMYWGQVDLNSMCAYFADPDRVVSANYGISKDGEICLSVDEKNRAWTTNNIENDGKAVTIEIASDQTPPYTMHQEAFDALVKLCEDICRRNRKTKLRWFPDKSTALSYALAPDEMLLTVHFWFFKTDCPGQWLYERMGDLAERVTALLGADALAAEGTNVPDKTDEPDESPEIVTPPADPLAYETPEKKPGGLQAKDLAKLSYAEALKILGPICREDHRKTGIPACITLAQMITESSLGRSELAKNANNCFGMKCQISGNTWPGSTWDGTSKYRMSTDEYNADGSKFTIAEDFRAYACVEDSIADHSAYLLGAMNGDAPRYAGLAGCADHRKAAQIIKDGGYATTPDYVDALLYYIELWDLEQWDAPATTDQFADAGKTSEDASVNQSSDATEMVTIPKSDWQAIKAAASGLYQAVKKYE